MGCQLWTLRFCTAAAPGLSRAVPPNPIPAHCFDFLTQGSITDPNECPCRSLSPKGPC